jgi:hypothetical protein
MFWYFLIYFDFYIWLYIWMLLLGAEIALSTSTNTFQLKPSLVTILVLFSFFFILYIFN